MHERVRRISTWIAISFIINDLLKVVLKHSISKCLRQSLLSLKQQVQVTCKLAKTMFTVYWTQFYIKLQWKFTIHKLKPSNELSKLQKQSSEVFYQKNCSYKKRF